MKLVMRMSSVRYTHTHRFAMEMLGFAQHFLQLQDVLGRMRAASAGKKVVSWLLVYEAYFLDSITSFIDKNL